jgi:hypothetical protein
MFSTANRCGSSQFCRGRECADRAVARAARRNEPGREVRPNVLPIIEFKLSSMVLVEGTYDRSHSLGMLTSEDHRQIAERCIRLAKTCTEPTDQADAREVDPGSTGRASYKNGSSLSPRATATQGNASSADSGRAGGRIFWHHRCTRLLFDHGDAGGRLRDPRSGRDPRRLWPAGSKADPLAVANSGLDLLVLVPDPCRRIGHRRGARENDWHHLSADLGQRDLWQACVAVIGFGSLKALARVALPIKVVVLTYLFVLFARHDDPNFELAKVRRSRGGVSFGWTSQSESHTLVYLNHDNAFVALPN